MLKRDLIIRRVTPLDEPALSKLLEPLPLEGRLLKRLIQHKPDGASWLVAELKSEIVGSQLIGPTPSLYMGMCDIGTFLKGDVDTFAIGSALFDETRKLTKKLGYGWINAQLKAENESGRTFYQSRGFRPYLRRDMKHRDDLIFMRFEI